MERTEPAVSEAQPTARKSVREKGFRELFDVQEFGYYGAAILVYILLGVLLRDRVLNFVVGPLFFIGWIWVVPPAWEKWRERRSHR